MHVSLVDCSLKIGRSKSYFNCMRLTNPKRFREIEELGSGDVVRGYFVQQDQRVAVVEELIAFYYELDEDKTEMLKFSSFLHTSGVYGKEGDFRDRRNEILFTPFDRITSTIYEEIEKIHRGYILWKSNT